MSDLLQPDRPILLVDDDEDVSRAVARILTINGYNNVIAINDSRKVLSLLQEREASLVFLDITMPHMQGDELLQEIVSYYPHLPVIMATASESIDMVVGCMKKGAFDYITKPLSSGRLLACISGALEVRELRRENEALRGKEQDHLPKQPDLFYDSVTGNREILNIFHYIEQVGPSAQPVLISGETGVGKELAARAVHRASGRSGRFVAVNVAGIDDDVFGDTLFGHIRGAYTGATSSREGQILKASSGTLFLDEIGDLSLKSQVKLLRLLQEKEFYPLGADIPQTSDARIIVATNRNIEEMLVAGAFRKDLYFRLNAHHVHLPPLRNRYDDLTLLVPHFVKLAATEFGKKQFSVPAELYTLLVNYSFPGNIRELKAMIFDAVSRQQGTVLGLEPFSRNMGLSEAKKSKVKAYSDCEPNVCFGDDLPSMKEVRYRLAEEALKRAGGNISIAARLIGLTRQSLSQFIRNNDIPLTHSPSEET
ncbi:MAG: sigma-54 dependent transcriptional regulator [Proteobacteria bacterium]|nr:sigma-54 dependent transcriptional regulator [Pseudomonadota bacterium]MBU4294484.1 sigma-54 dependent transcriptional regulator [Pseudomonadota bacterium]MCG2749768.1 sigma-54 dependent transcriptional regulator [Desulfobulbaceae bacterium]